MDREQVKDFAKQYWLHMYAALVTFILVVVAISFHYETGNGFLGGCSQDNPAFFEGMRGRGMGIATDRQLTQQLNR